MSNVMRRLRVLGELLGCTVLVVHHAAKSSDSTRNRRPGQRARGSSAIHGSTDSGIYLADTKGNGTDEFTNAVTVEIKGARSAGAFTLELAIQDDKNGEAACAVWTLRRSGASTPGETQDTEDLEDATFEYVRNLINRGMRLTPTGYRGHKERPTSVPWKKVIPTIHVLIEKRRLRLDDAGLVQLLTPVQTEFATPEPGASGLHSRDR
jgi:hypothetical protein